MLPKENRLKKQKDFDSVLRSREIFFGKFLILKRIENNLKESRVAFIVSKKVSSKAIVRNKIKRRLREIVRGDLKKIKNGYDIVFFTKKGVEKMEYSEVKKEVEQLFKKSNLYNETINIKNN